MCRVTVGFPCMALAQDAEMSFNEYETFVFNACLLNWQNLSKTLDKIKSYFKKDSTVHLIGENIDLKMKVKGHLAKADKGEENMPGGEVFMAPIKETVEGWVKFDYPSIRSSKEVCDIYLKFKQGKVVQHSASKNAAFLSRMLYIDENASYVGELGIGCNPKITKYTKNLLFDEKISGKIHIALGAAYKENWGGNDSALHWDLVKDMKKANIIVDGKIIQEKGIWKI